LNCASCFSTTFLLITSEGGERAIAGGIVAGGVFPRLSRHSILGLVLIHGSPIFGDLLRPLVIILGPTASGKTALAIRVAQHFGGEVLACDSTQVYRGFDIGTAKPTAAECGGIPHHLIDLAEPTELFSAGEYRRRALPVLEEIGLRRHLPILTVGTGLYLRALIEGLAEAPERSEQLRARLMASASRHDHAYLHRLLRRLDPPSAARISQNDTQKLIRSIEICLLAGKPLSEVHRTGREPLRGYLHIKIGIQPPRDMLHRRIEDRVRKMIERGWLDEVTALLRRDEMASTKPFEFIGYRELRDHLQGHGTLEDAIQKIAVATRQYAKRQMTWFRKEAGVTWLPGFGDAPSVLSEVLRMLDEKITPIG
jgi:tRNA dimethylallyltransferase